MQKSWSKGKSSLTIILIPVNPILLPAIKYSNCFLPRNNLLSILLLNYGTYFNIEKSILFEPAINVLFTE